MSRKIFKVAKDINKGIGEIINAVKNNVGSFRYEVIALSRIEKDPDNPREVLLTEKDIKFGIDVNDSQSSRKIEEKKSLESLAYTIKNRGVINPIVVYKFGEKYRIIAGERRFLAASMVGKDDIHARILDSKPNEVDLKILQWTENNERKDLSLKERLSNLQSILEAYCKTHSGEAASIDLLKKLTGLSNTQAFCYFTVLMGYNDLKEGIENGRINNLEKAALAAGIDDQELRTKVIIAATEGKSLRFLKEMISAERDKKKIISTGNKKRRAHKYVHLGKTKNAEIIKKIIEIVLSQPNYREHTNKFSNINWNEHKKVALAFQDLLSIIAQG